MSTTNLEASNQLHQYRSEIDAIDAKLAQLLMARASIVGNVKQLKDAHWPNACHIRPAREAQMHAAMFALFKGSLLGAQAGAEFWRLIISASTMIESALHIITLASTEATSQGYFSPLAQYHVVSDMQAMAAEYAKRNGAILCLPAPLNETSAALFVQHENLRMFAYAPLVLQNTSAPTAYFAANITCEPSGNDLSYFLHNGSIACIEGYHETHPTQISARFIGAHGKPLAIDSL